MIDPITEDGLVAKVEIAMENYDLNIEDSVRLLFDTVIELIRSFEYTNTNTTLENISFLKTSEKRIGEMLQEHKTIMLEYDYVDQLEDYQFYLQNVLNDFGPILY